MVCSGVQIKGRGEDMQGGVVCSAFAGGLTLFSGAWTSWRSVGPAGPSQAHRY